MFEDIQESRAFRALSNEEFAELPLEEKPPYLHRAMRELSDLVEEFHLLRSA